MTTTRLLRVLGSVALFLSLGAGLQAQTILVTSGEHAGFTRVVLQSAAPIDWRLDSSAGARQVALALGARQIDLSRSLRRIGRTRVETIAMADGRLVLDLACACRVQAWTERPGLVVIDIGDPEAAVATDTAASLPMAPSTGRHGLAAGLALARAWQTRHEDHARTPDSPPVPLAHLAHPADPERDRAGLLGLITRQLAGATGQGVLVAAGIPEPASISTQLSGTAHEPVTGLPLRVTSVVDRPNLSSLVLEEPDAGGCADTEAMAFLVDGSGPGFNAGLAGYMRDWIGEFDRMDPMATLMLARHYLRHGFGAEARSLLEQSATPVDGQTLLMGLADLFENRSSNALRLLASFPHCGGPAALIAALSGAPSPRVATRATGIALAFAQLPEALRAILGAELVRVLIDAGSIDAARVIAETLRRSTEPGSHDLALIDAMLDHARGNTQSAIERLESGSTGDLARLRMRLMLARENAEVVPVAHLDAAEALAATQRSTATGQDLMADVIQLRLLRGEGEIALSLLDRLSTWSGSDERQQRQLRDDIWRELAEQADDATMIVLALTRDDWRDPALSAATRLSIDTRLSPFDLGPHAVQGGDPAPEPIASVEELRVSRTLQDVITPGATAQRPATDDPRPNEAGPALLPSSAVLRDAIATELLTGPSPFAGSLPDISGQERESGLVLIEAGATPDPTSDDESAGSPVNDRRMQGPALSAAAPMTPVASPGVDDPGLPSPEPQSAAAQQAARASMMTRPPDSTEEPGMLQRAGLLLEESLRLRLSLAAAR